MTQTSAVLDGATANKAVPMPVFLKIGDSLELPAVSMTFDRNEEIYGETDPAEFVYQVVRGAVRTTRYLEDGRRQVGAFHLPQDIFGVEAGDTHRFTAEAIVDTEVRLVKRSVLEAATSKDIRAARALWTLTSVHLEKLQDQVLLLGRKSALERVAAFLLEMVQRKPNGTAVDLPMSRNDIADYLGLTIETVSRTLTQLERTKAIALPSSRHIVLCNQSALAMA
jgi:CRP/FNR family nitrogen fixation transcriptional regulator